MSATRFSSFFRQAGLNYLEAVNTSTNALRAVLKEPMKSEVMGRSTFTMRTFTYAGGEESAPSESVRALRLPASRHVRIAP